MANKTDLEKQTHVRVSKDLLERLNKRANKVGLRRAAYVRGVVLASLASGLPTMALEAAGGTKEELLCLRLRTSDFNKLERVARKAGVTTSNYLRAVLAERVGEHESR